ncbi:MAG: adenylosuccinate lyase [Bifidobacteriaceae bacterium]|jgi:adenylosuccinate lyase|nr:adenylosuccinate lyase [Bifidobacteriaceae bacterium]
MPTSFASLEPRPTLGPLDGRYAAATAPLLDYFSEAALNRARVLVEVEWFIHLLDGQVLPGGPALGQADRDYLRQVVEGFGPAEIAELATIERETVHDVKAVEYFLRRRLADAAAVLGPGTKLGPDLNPVIHFALTSEDVNSLSYAWVIRGGIRKVWLPAATELAQQLGTMARANADLPMLARTHGQPATPTTLGKELAVTVRRLERQIGQVEKAEYLGKLNGASGTFGAHVAAVPEANWPAISRGFVEKLGLSWNPLTTQIESHDWQAELYSHLARFGRIAHNLATDMWTYISLGYFSQARGQGTVGSSTMPHKVNPIRFENAEANLEISAALFDTLAATLVTSRLQRDLTDSTTQRNIGVAVGHSLLAIDNLRRGLAGLDINPVPIAADLVDNPEVLAEPIQSAMRAAAIAGIPGMDDPYERLKELTRGRRVTLDEIHEFIAGLGLPPDVTLRLRELSPASYTGLAARLVADYL